MATDWQAAAGKHDTVVGEKKQERASETNMESKI